MSTTLEIDSTEQRVYRIIEKHSKIVARLSTELKTACCELREELEPVAGEIAERVRQGRIIVTDDMLSLMMAPLEKVENDAKAVMNDFEDMARESATLARLA